MSDTVKPVPLVTLNLTADELQILVDAVEDAILYADSDENLGSLVAKVWKAMDKLGRGKELKELLS